jgi:hypothetical protein
VGEIRKIVEHAVVSGKQLIRILDIGDGESED